MHLSERHLKIDIAFAAAGQSACLQGEKPLVRNDDPYWIGGLHLNGSPRGAHGESQHRLPFLELIRPGVPTTWPLRRRMSTGWFVVGSRQRALLRLLWTRSLEGACRFSGHEEKCAHCR